jgi:hypothetical protein
VQYIAALYSTVQHIAAQHSTLQYGTVQYSELQDGTLSFAWSALSLSSNGDRKGLLADTSVCGVGGGGTGFEDEEDENERTWFSKGRGLWTSICVHV